jgi:hypothetical protein
MTSRSIADSAPGQADSRTHDNRRYVKLGLIQTDYPYPPFRARVWEALVYLRGWAMLAMSIRALLILISGLAVAIVVFLIATG